MATDAIYNYMKMQNRPYSVNDVVSNLQNKYNKTVVQKTMDQLVTDGKLFEKVYGKQKVYCAVQDSTCNSDELMRIDNELQTHANEVESKYQEVKKELQKQEALLASLKSSLSLEDLQKEKNTSQQNIKQLSLKLDTLMKTNGTKDLHEFKRKAQEDLDGSTREYLKRKRMCTEIIDCILENFPISKDDLYEEVGIDSVIIQ